MARTDSGKARNVQEVNRFAGKNKSQDCIGAVRAMGLLDHNAGQRVT